MYMNNFRYRLNIDLYIDLLMREIGEFALWANRFYNCPSCEFLHEC